MDSETLKKLMVKVAKEELGENEKTRDQMVKQFKDWMEQNPDIRNYNGDDRTALLYLRKGKFSIQKAQEVFLKGENYRNVCPHFMGNADILDPKVNIFVKNGYQYVSPFTTEAGCHIVFLDLSRVNPSQCDYTDHVRAQVGTAQTLMYKEIPQVLGVIYVLDMANVTAAQATHMPVGESIPYMKAVQQAVPLRFKGFHFINMSTPVKWFFDLLKSTANEKMKSRFMAHSSLEEFHKHVSPSVLPKEYGGTMPRQEMIDLWYKELLAARDTVSYWNSFRVVQPENSDFKTSLAELPGTFRKLEVD